MNAARTTGPIHLPPTGFRGGDGTIEHCLVQGDELITCFHQPGKLTITDALFFDTGPFPTGWFGGGSRLAGYRRKNLGKVELTFLFKENGKDSTITVKLAVEHDCKGSIGNDKC